MLSQAAQGRFEVLRRIGSGSFGHVLEALDRRRNRVVAVKVLDRIAPDTLARFKREFRTLADLRHPNLASLYELIVLDDQWLLTMELVSGSDLLEHLALIELQQTFLEIRGGAPVDGDERVVMRRRRGGGISAFYADYVRSMFQQLALALGVLHARGVVHRDIKPANIMVVPGGRVVVLDFGLIAESSLEDSIDRGGVVGTPGYMSPEQIASSVPTFASDWYSFGVLLHQALTGSLPFHGQTPMDVLHAQMQGEPASAALTPGVPEDLSRLIAGCLSREPAKRPSDREILERLEVRDFNPFHIERSSAREGVLIGRGRELRTLRGWVAAARQGKARVGLLSGSPGVGKSALLHLLLDELRRADDAFLLAGRCHPWESLPFNAVDTIVDALAREIRRGHLPAVDPIMARAVAVTELFPSLPRGVGFVDDETIALPQTGERQLTRAVDELRALVRAAAGNRTVVIVLDDAQWGDYQSAQVFRELLKPDGDDRLLLLLSYRTEDWRTSLLLQGLHLAERRPKARQLVLDDLSRTMTRRLLKEWTGRQDVQTADAVFRETGGNPALIRIAADVPGDASLDRGVRARLADVSAAARQLIDLLSRSSAPVEEEKVAKTLELFEIDEPIRTLQAQRLIRLRRTGNLAEIDLYHDRLRAVLAD